MHGSVHGWCMAWCMAWCMVGDVVGVGAVWWGWGYCMCVLPGLVRLDLGVGVGLDGGVDEVVGVVLC